MPRRKRLEETPLVRTIPIAGLPAVQPDIGGALLAESLSNQFSAFAESVNKVEDATTERQAEVAGILAGQGEKFIKRPANTLANLSFNRAGVETFKSNLAIRARAQIQKISIENEADPIAMESAIDDYHKGLLTRFGDIPELIQPINELVASEKLTLTKSAFEKYRLGVEDAAEASVNQSAEMLLTSIENRAFNSDSPEEIGAIVSGGLNEMINLFAANGPRTAFEIGGHVFGPDITRTNAFTATEIQAVLADQKEKVEEAVVFGAFERAYDSGIGFDFVSNFVNNPNPFLSPERYEALASSLVTRMNRRHNLISNRISLQNQLDDKRYSDNERVLLTHMLRNQLSGTPNDPKLLVTAVDNDDISTTFASTNWDRSLSQGPPVSDQFHFAMQMLNPLRPENIEDIAQDPLLTTEDRLEVMNERIEIEDDRAHFANRPAYQKISDNIESEFGFFEGVTFNATAENKVAVRNAGRLVDQFNDQVRELVAQTEGRLGLEFDAMVIEMGKRLISGLKGEAASVTLRELEKGFSDVTVFGKDAGQPLFPYKTMEALNAARDAEDIGLAEYSRRKIDLEDQLTLIDEQRKLIEAAQ